MGRKLIVRLKAVIGIVPTTVDKKFPATTHHSPLTERRLEDTQVATVQAIRGQEKLSAWDFFYALDMAIAYLIS